MILAGHSVLGNTVTVLGLTFKENCPDIRNTRVIDIVHALREYCLSVQVCDPLADPEEARSEYGLDLVPLEALQPAAAVVTAVAHEAFRRLSPPELRRLMGEGPVLIDVKGVYPRSETAAAGIRLWRL